MPCTFTPPTENSVPTIEFDAPSLANRLMRYYPARKRGRAVWKLADGTFSFDQPLPTVFPEAAAHSDLFPDPTVTFPPPLFPKYDSNLKAVTVLGVYLGGHVYLVPDTECALLDTFLTDEGYTSTDWLIHGVTPPPISGGYTDIYGDTYQ